MTPQQEDDAKRKCIHEIKALIHRWAGDESDLEDGDVVECLTEAVNEYYEEEVVEFESDIDLGDDEETGD